LPKRAGGNASPVGDCISAIASRNQPMLGTHVWMARLFSRTPGHELLL
jgi:hypothetical protein